MSTCGRTVGTAGDADEDSSRQRLVRRLRCRILAEVE